MATQRSKHPHALPLQLTSFVGREEEIARARELLHTTRLLTLTGAGGSGKTRMAIAIAEDVQDVFTNGVVFVSLAPIAAPARVSSAIAEAMKAAFSPDRPPIDQLVDMLDNQNLLLVLDNFEQVVAAAPLVADLLVGCPRLTILVTSRVPLHLSSEQVFLVPPLALPETGDRLVLDDIKRNAAVTLFVVRARTHDPTFQIAEGNARGGHRHLSTSRRTSARDRAGGCSNRSSSLHVSWPTVSSAGCLRWHVGLSTHHGVSRRSATRSHGATSC